MGTRPRMRPRRIGAKLRQIRDALGLSQNQLARRLRLPKEFKRTLISNYENDEREPPLFVLLAYAREAGICLETIVDDAINVPLKLPVTPAHRPIEISSKRTVGQKQNPA
jgi:transcriptional regulator with XRE-family HTH domain